MKINFLGTGTAFTLKNNQTNFLIQMDSKYNLLVDCGGDARFALDKVGLSHLDIHGVYVSHLHSDHIGGLEWLAFASYFDPRYKGKPALFISEFLVDDLWARSLSGGMSSLQGQRNTLETFFDMQIVPKNHSFKVPTVDSPEFKLVQTIHFVNGFTFELSFGLIFEARDETVFITTDTQYAPNQIQDFYDQATVIYHDAECAPYKSGVHAHYDDLKKLDEETKAKIYLVHYQDNVVDHWDEWQEKAQADGFRGFVRQGHVEEF